MQFRPCIDIHNGKVKQIVGGSLSEKTGSSVVKENFVSDQDAAFFARFYMDYGIKGGHVIMLNKSGTAEYELTKKAALEAGMNGHIAKPIAMKVLFKELKNINLN